MHSVRKRTGKAWWRSGNAAVCKTAMRGFDSRPRLLNAEVVELVDTKDLKSFAFGRAGSIPALGTENKKREYG